MGQVFYGYFQTDGRFVADNTSVSIPVMRRVIVNILDDETVDTNATSRQRTESLLKLFEEAENAENDLSDEEWEEFTNLRSQTDFSREVREWFTP